MTDAETYEKHRPALFAIAYRMLGSASDAEDVVQDAWLRYHAADRTTLQSPRAFLSTIVTRLCLDRLKSARATRETYIGPWLPEPVLTSSDSPEEAAQRAESITLAFLLMLDALTPEERAVFLLKEVFDYGHAEIGEMLDMSAANSRQLFHRAKSHLASHRPRMREAPAARRAVAEQYVRALREGDAAVLAALLAPDVGFWGDGGGKAVAARRPILGRDEVLRLLTGFARTARTLAGRVTYELIDANHEPAILVRNEGVLDSIHVVSVEQGQVVAIRAVRNPDKLGYVARQLATALSPEP